MSPSSFEKTKPMDVFIVITVLLGLVVVVLVVVGILSHARRVEDHTNLDRKLEALQAALRARREPVYREEQRKEPREEPREVKVAPGSTHGASMDTGDVCRTDNDCDAGVCSRARILHLRNGLDGVRGMDLRTQELDALVLDKLEEHHLNVEDVRTIVVDGEEHLVVTTGTRSVLVHRPGLSRLVEANVPLGGIAPADGRLYALSQDRVVSMPLAREFSRDVWTLATVAVLPARGVHSVESSHDERMLTAETDQGTFYLQRGAVVRRESSRDARILGATAEEFAVSRNGGMDVFPNSEHIAGADVGVITADNRLFHARSDANAWLKRMRSISGEPVFITRGVCSVDTETPRAVA